MTSYPWALVLANYLDYAITLVVAVPSFLRGNALLIALAVLLIIGTALVWLPPVRSRVRR